MLDDEETTDNELRTKFNQRWNRTPSGDLYKPLRAGTHSLTHTLSLFLSLTENMSFSFPFCHSLFVLVDNAPSLLLFPSSFSLVPSNITSLPQRELISATSWTRPSRRTRSWRTATTPTVKWSPCCVNRRMSSMLPFPPPTRPGHCKAARCVRLYWSVCIAK